MDGGSPDVRLLAGHGYYDILLTHKQETSSAAWLTFGLMYSLHVSCQKIWASD